MIETAGKWATRERRSTSSHGASRRCRCSSGALLGSVVACRVAASDSRVRALLVLGFPASRIADSSFLTSIQAPRLFVQGERDVFGGADVIRPLVDALPEPQRLAVVPEADHFFTGKLDALQTIVAEWAGGRPWERPTP